jgi:class 3 adenylate cyclase
MALPKVIPALADLTQDLAGPVPVELLYAWASGEQTPARAAELLEPFRLEGIVVASDTSGLSRLTKERDLLDVLAMISEPKQILHAIGVEIGGRPIGTWVADNTQTFYPPTVGASTIVAAMSEAEQRITCELSIGVGMCVHRGAFYELGGGFYGNDAHIVEAIAEHHAGPGQILATQGVKDACGRACSFAPHLEMAGLDDVPLYLLSAADPVPALAAKDRRYPHPYPQDFFNLLGGLKRADPNDPVRKRIYDTYLRRMVVVFVARSRDGSEDYGPAALLDELVENVLVDAIVLGLENARNHIAGVGGGIAILTFDAASAALDAAHELRARFAANSLAVKIGLASGPVLLFSNPRGPSGIAGSPINIASKISEDAGIAGQIHVAADVAAQLDGLPKTNPFEVAVGGVTLHGFTV